MKVLIIGLGSIAHKHIAALRKINPECEIMALRSSLTAAKFDGVRNLYSYNEIEGEKFDFVVISTPTSEHLKSIEAVQKLGCPLFIEKPIFHTLECQSIVDKLSSSGTLTYVACNLRFLECLNFIKESLVTKDKRINEVNVYCGSYLPEWRKGVNFRTVYSSIPELGGGVHIDLIHEIDYLYWLFGKPLETVRTTRNTSSLDIRAIDYANYCLVYPSFCASVILNYYRRDYKRTLEIVWEDETWCANLSKNEVRCGETILFKSDKSPIDTYESQLRYFINLLNTNQNTSFNSVADAMEVLKICIGNESKK